MPKWNFEFAYRTYLNAFCLCQDKVCVMYTAHDPNWLHRVP